MRKYYVHISLIVCILSITIMCLVLYSSPNVEEDFVVPEFEENAQTGTPEVPEEMNYATLEIDEDYIVYICGEVIVEDGVADIYLTNDSENNIWLKLRILDEDENVIAETGILKQGEYLQSIEFTENVTEGQTIQMKIMAYEPETYYSAGTVLINNSIQIGGV